MFLLPFIPFLGWAFGDYYIQKTTRTAGVVQALWYIGALSTVVGAAFFVPQLGQYLLSDYVGLTGIAGVIFIYAIVLFKAFEVGKLSVVEAIVGFELPLSVMLAVFLANESVTLFELVLVLCVCIGVVLASVTHIAHLTAHRHWVEKGALLALAGAALSAMTNVLVGMASTTADPFFVIWYTHAVLFVLCTVVLIVRGQMHTLGTSFRIHPRIILLAAFCDNIAWFGYAYATSLLPISHVVTISEGYIALAAYLGYRLSGEKLKLHQKVGIVLAIAAVITFSIISSHAD